MSKRRRCTITIIITGTWTIHWGDTTAMPFAISTVQGQQTQSMNKETMMTATENIATIHRFWQGFNTHNLDIWDEVCTPTFINHDPGLPTPDADLATIKQTIAHLMFGAFPDMQALEEDLFAAGDKVVTRRTLRGTHLGELMGIAPTGKLVSAGGVWLSHLSNGKIVEQWVYFDLLGILHQVGAKP